MELCTTDISVIAEEFRRQLDLKRECRIHYHIRPDGDTVCSSYALMNELRRRGFRCAVVGDGKIPDKYNRYIGAIGNDELSEPVEVSVDVSTPERLGKYRTRKMDFVFDHHFPNRIEAPFVYTRPEAAACSEVIYELLCALGWGDIEKKSAELLLIAVLTDTYCFRSMSVSQSTMELVSKLGGFGVDYPLIIRDMYMSVSRAELETERFIMNNMRFYADNRIVSVLIKRADMEKIGMKQEDLENIPSFIDRIDGVIMAVTVREGSDGMGRISLRTKGNADAAEILSAAGGGGHSHSAGCEPYVSPEDAQKLAVRLCMEYLEQE